MLREMRRKDREITADDAVEILKRNTYGILSTIGEGGYPYGVPVSYACANDVVYFHCAVEGHKLANLKSNDKVSFCVVGKTETLADEFATKYESAIVFGKAIEIFDDEKYTALMELLKKYSADYIEEGKEYIRNSGDATRVFKITMEHISGKARR